MTILGTGEVVKDFDCPAVIGCFPPQQFSGRLFSLLRVAGAFVFELLVDLIGLELGRRQPGGRHALAVRQICASKPPEWKPTQATSI
jgi:hypothetical protein